MFTTLVSFVLVIGVLILIHELGHFLVARWVGVGVERFSIGFGPVLLRWRGKETEYCLSAIPMGGYVKMMGEENPLESGQTLPFDPNKAFSLKPLWARFLIVFAGPGMNFILAAIIFALLFMTIGRPVYPAIVGRVAEGGPAAAGLRTGDQIGAVNGQTVTYWEDVERAVARSDGRPLELKVQRGASVETVTITPRQVTLRDPIFKDAQQAWDLGAGPKLIPQIGAVTSGSPAAKAGLNPGDIVLAVAGQPVFTDVEMKQAIEKRAGQPLTLTIERQGRTETVTVTPIAVKEKGPTGQEVEVGRIGVSITVRTVTFEPYSPVAAIGQGFVRTWDMTVVTVKGLWKVLVGSIDRSNIGGPIQIASEAGKQAKEGASQLAFFTAIISINLAVLNLLPVPMLDGGHLAFFIIEAVIGRPISARKREAAQQVGFVMLMLLMVYALYNDLVRIDAFKFFK